METRSTLPSAEDLCAVSRFLFANMKEELASGEQSLMMKEYYISTTNKVIDNIRNCKTDEEKNAAIIEVITTMQALLDNGDYSIAAALRSAIDSFSKNLNIISESKKELKKFLYKYDTELSPQKQRTIFQKSKNKEIPFAKKGITIMPPVQATIGNAIATEGENYNNGKIKKRNEIKDTKKLEEALKKADDSHKETLVNIFKPITSRQKIIREELGERYNSEDILSPNQKDILDEVKASLVNSEKKTACYKELEEQLKGLDNVNQVDELTKKIYQTLENIVMASLNHDQQRMLLDFAFEYYKVDSVTGLLINFDKSRHTGKLPDHINSIVSNIAILKGIPSGVINDYNQLITRTEKANEKAKIENKETKDTSVEIEKMKKKGFKTTTIAMTKNTIDSLRDTMAKQIMLEGYQVSQPKESMVSPIIVAQMLTVSAIELNKEAKSISLNPPLSPQDASKKKATLIRMKQDIETKYNKLHEETETIRKNVELLTKNTLQMTPLEISLNTAINVINERPNTKKDETGKTVLTTRDDDSYFELAIKSLDNIVNKSTDTISQKSTQPIEPKNAISASHEDLLNLINKIQNDSNTIEDYRSLAELADGILTRRDPSEEHLRRPLTIIYSAVQQEEYQYANDQFNDLKKMLSQPSRVLSSSQFRTSSTAMLQVNIKRNSANSESDTENNIPNLTSNDPVSAPLARTRSKFNTGNRQGQLLNKNELENAFGQEINSKNQSTISLGKK